MATMQSLPTTPPFTQITTILPTQLSPTPPINPTTLLSPPSFSSSSPGNSNGAGNSAATTSAIIPNGSGQSAGTTVYPPGMLVASTSVGGLFGVGANLDPLIIFGLVVGGLLLLLFFAILIYCCCAYCGVPTRRDYLPPMRRTSSLRSINIIEEPCHPPPPARPLFFRASIGPECPTCGAEPAASVLLDQPLRVNVGAYAVGDGTCGTLATKRVVGSYPRMVRQQAVQPSVIVTRSSIPRVQTVRKKYLYPVDNMGMTNGLTYNAVTPNSLGDGYLTGRSLRSVGNRYGGGGLVFYDD